MAEIDLAIYAVSGALILSVMLLGLIRRTDGVFTYVCAAGVLSAAAGVLSVTAGDGAGVYISALLRGLSGLSIALPVLLPRALGCGSGGIRIFSAAAAASGIVFLAAGEFAPGFLTAHAVCALLIYVSDGATVMADCKDKRDRGFILSSLAVSAVMCCAEFLVSLPSLTAAANAICSVILLYMAERGTDRRNAERVNAHFIFNALGTVQYLYETGRGGADDVMRNLCGYLRGALDFSRRLTTARFDDETELVGYYASVEKIRFPGIDVGIHADFTDFRLPFHTLLPLVETAVDKNIRPHGVDGKVLCESRDCGAYALVSIRDNGRGQADEDAYAEVRGRLRMLCGGTLTVRHGADGDGFLNCVELKIPKKKGGAA